MLNYPINYPISPIYNNPDFFTTGITLPERHKIRAQYYLNTLPPPGDEYIINQIASQLQRDITFDLAQLIKVKCEVFPGWMPNTKQIEIVKEHLEKLNQLERCTTCSLIIGNYCQEPSYKYQELKSRNPHSKKPCQDKKLNNSSSSSHNTTMIQNPYQHNWNCTQRNIKSNLSHSQETSLKESIAEALDHPIQHQPPHIQPETSIGRLLGISLAAFTGGEIDKTTQNSDTCHLN